MRGPCTAGQSTRCGSGWWTSTARWPPPLSAPIDLVLEVRDEFCLERRPLTVRASRRGYCGRTDRDPDLILGIEELSAAYLGGVSLATLQAAGRVTEVSPGAVTLASTAFSWPVTPWCPDEF